MFWNQPDFSCFCEAISGISCEAPFEPSDTS
jgi:hypothetical protein